MNTIVGTRAPSGPGARPRSTARIVASEKRRYAAAVSSPPQVSKIITASAPAAICSLRYAATARALTSTIRCSRSGRAYAIRRTVAKSSSLPPPSIM